MMDFLQRFLEPSPTITPLIEPFESVTFSSGTWTSSIKFALICFWHSHTMDPKEPI